MDQPLCTNEIIVNAPKGHIEALLMSAATFLILDPKILDVQQIATHHYLLIHKQGPFKKSTLLDTHLGKDFVDYTSKNGAFTYQIRFDLDEQVGQTKITQSFILMQATSATLIVKMLKSRIQKGMVMNLVNLKKIAEAKLL